MKPLTRVVPASTTLEPPNRLTGYAAKFGVPSTVLYDDEVCKGPFVEVIEPGAFARSLAENPDVRALYNHSTSDVLGRTKNGTLVVAEDSVGLRFELELPDTSAGRDVRELVRLGTIDGCSFGFFAIEDRLEPRAGGPTVRHLVECHVYEITPATAFPAYDATEVRLRSTRHAAPPGPAPTPRLALARARLRLAGP